MRGRLVDGAPNLDCRCTGSAIGDYLRSSDLSHLPPDVQSTYLPGHPQPVLRDPATLETVP